MGRGRAPGRRLSRPRGRPRPSRPFQAVHANDPDPKLLAYQYLQTLPQLAKSEGSTLWVIPMRSLGAALADQQAFGDAEAPPEGTWGIAPPREGR